MKLVAPEPETEALVERLATDPERVSSSLALVEVLRAVRRVAQTDLADDEHWTRARQVLSRVALIRIDRPVLRSAAEVGSPALRTLDAIHLATALSISPKIVALLTYDKRMQAAAEDSGLNVESPGGP